MEFDIVHRQGLYLEGLAGIYTEIWFAALRFEQQLNENGITKFTGDRRTDLPCSAQDTTQYTRNMSRLSLVPNHILHSLRILNNRSKICRG